MGFDDGNSNSHTDLTAKSESVAMFTLYTLLLLGLVLPVSMYYMWELWQIRAHPVIEKRRPKLVLWYHAGLLLFTAQRILRCGLLCGIWTGSDHSGHARRIGNAGRILSVMSVNFLLLCFVFRAYLLMFDLRYHKGILNGQWKQIINVHSQQRDWFLNHRQTFGSEDWVRFRLFVPLYICSVIPAIIANSGVHSLSSMAVVTDLAVQIACFVAAAAIYFLSPKINDQFRIHDEFTLSCLLLGFGIMLYPLGELIFGPFVDCLVTNMICGLLYYMVGLVPTYWVLEWSGTVSHIWQGRPLRIFSMGTTEKLRDRSLKSERGETQREELVNALKSALSLRRPHPSTVIGQGDDSNDTPALPKQKTSEDEREEQTNARKMREMLMNKTGFQLFMAHMIREFSEENLLFIVEVTQFFFYIQALYQTVESQLTKQMEHEAAMTAQSLALAGMVSEEHPIGMSKASVVTDSGSTSCLPGVSAPSGFGGVSGVVAMPEIVQTRSIIGTVISPLPSPMMSPFAPPVQSTVLSSNVSATMTGVGNGSGFPSVPPAMISGPSSSRVPNISESKYAAAFLNHFPRYTRSVQAPTLTASTRTGMGTVVPDPENPVLHGMSWLGGLTLPNDLPQSTIVFGEGNQLIYGGLQGTLKRFLFGRHGIGTSLSGSKPVPSEVVIKDLEDLYNANMVADVTTVAAKQAYSAMSSPKKRGIGSTKTKSKTWTETMGTLGTDGKGSRLVRKKQARPIVVQAYSSSLRDISSIDQSDRRLANRVSSISPPLRKEDQGLDKVVTVAAATTAAAAPTSSSSSSLSSVKMSADEKEDHIAIRKHGTFDLKITQISESTGDLTSSYSAEEEIQVSVDGDVGALAATAPASATKVVSRSSTLGQDHPTRGTRASTGDLHIDIVAAADAAVEMAFRRSFQRNNSKISRRQTQMNDAQNNSNHRTESLAVPKPKKSRIGHGSMDEPSTDSFVGSSFTRPPSGTFVESTNETVAEEAYDLLLQMTRVKAMKLCEKYVLDGSEFMVNIGHQCRFELTGHYHQRFVEHQLTDLQLVFANAAQEIMRLMVNPFSRFLVTSEYESYERLIKKK